MGKQFFNCQARNWDSEKRWEEQQLNDDKYRSLQSFEGPKMKEKFERKKKEEEQGNNNKQGLGEIKKGERSRKFWRVICPGDALILLFSQNSNIINQYLYSNLENSCRNQNSTQYGYFDVMMIYLLNRKQVRVGKLIKQFYQRIINMNLDLPSFQESLPPNQQLAQYKSNIKTFLQEIQKQISTLIDHYQHQIQQLLKQNRKLKGQLNHPNNPQSNIFERDVEFDCISPIKKGRGSSSGFYNTAKSNLFQTNDFPKVQPIYSTNTKKLTYHSDQTQLNPLGKSRFQIQSKKKKQHQEELLQSLEAGKTNLDLNTTKFLSMIGRSPENQEEVQEQVILQKKIKKNDSLNTSLNSICESLDTSFYAKRARAKSQKKKKKQEQSENEQLKKKQEQEKVKKDQTLKNLLRSLRNNISSSRSKPPEIIKGTRLMATGSQLKNTSKTIGTKSKVMINPVPVDITQRVQFSSRQSGESSPTKRSILKQSAVLTKSIANISAISFNSSGVY